MKISDLHNGWRDVWAVAKFRDAEFYVETNARQGGRRVALHQYPKRSVPYAEDMGRTANQFIVQGYCIGPYYLGRKDDLIEKLEMDGPGTLVLPLQYKLIDVEVMVASYSVTESRERGGICMVEMNFIEYGDPNYRETPSIPAQVEQSAAAVEQAVVGPQTPQQAEQTQEETGQYNDNWVSGMQ
jgi:prophage DNA circulation protein